MKVSFSLISVGSLVNLQETERTAALLEFIERHSSQLHFLAMALHWFIRIRSDFRLLAWQLEQA